MRIGIDLGGTKIECIGLDAGGGEIHRRRISAPRGDYDATLRAIAELVEECDRALLSAAAAARKTQDAGGVAGLPSVGIGTPGAVSPATGLMKNSNSIWLNGRPLARDLEALLGRPLRLANDANCFALSEAVDGAAAGARVVFGVILGTGTGGGIVVDGRVLVGPNAVSGEWGHNPLPWPRPSEWPGPPCYCGRSGCIETFLSGPGLARDYREAGGRQDSSGAGAVEIAVRAAAGEPEAVQAIRRYAERASRALAGVINFLDPDVIVLGGGMSNLSNLYQEIPSLWGRWVFSDRVDTPLVPPKHGDASGVRGAAWLWPPRV